MVSPAAKGGSLRKNRERPSPLAGPMASVTGMPPRVQSAPTLLPSDDIESIFSNLSYRDFLHHEPAIAEEGEQPPDSSGAAAEAGRLAPAQQPTPPTGPPGGFSQPQHIQQLAVNLSSSAVLPGPAGTNLPQRPHTSVTWGGAGSNDVATSAVSRQLELKLLEAQQVYEHAQQLQHEMTGPVSGRTVASVPVDLLDHIAQVRSAARRHGTWRPPPPRPPLCSPCPLCALCSPLPCS